ncbi:hypothetical protein AB1Y20_008820 [Prymnesium parvum]|uniref:Histidine phosphatase family protein n=1 Tax=Prymnesium parvum TaxID=97485 RepID=A0AB34IVN8_PRYPA
MAAVRLRDIVAAGKLTRIALLRHGKTNKMADDLARSLTPEGVDLTRASAEKWSIACGAPTLAESVFCSRAQRTQQTAALIVPGTPHQVVPSIYPEAGEALNSRECDTVNAVFAHKGYAPLQAYLDHDGGSLSPALETYAENVWAEVLDLYAPKADAAVAVFSHAVFVSATARFAARALGADEKCILDSNVGEACGFLLMQAGDGAAWTVQYVTHLE